MRETGILLHPTSLPGPAPAGTLGDQALAFVDQLAEAGATIWQVLPLGPAGMGGSPYMSPSAFAGNSALIDGGWLVARGLASEHDLPAPCAASDRIDVDAQRIATRWLTECAASRFADGSAPEELRDAYRTFVDDNASWLQTWVEFAVIDDQFGSVEWPRWPAPLRDREPGAVEELMARNAAAVERERIAQFLFDQQWGDVRRHGAERGVSIMGDIPIFVSHHSADVWGDRELFDLNDAGWPNYVAGVPPDYFSVTGQRWGNPLYRWDVSARTGHRWWIERFRRTFAMCDQVRVDHFRGFDAYWQIPAQDATAVNGRWVRGPGRSLFDAVFAPDALGPCDVIAEDLGVITPAVEALRDGLGLPGMKILHFAFGDDDANVHLPHLHTPRSVVYTGTHDNDTTIGWWEHATPNVRDHVRRYLGVNGQDIEWAMINTALRSASDIAVLPMQDVLSLGTNARMNTPGTTDGNWAWRMLPGAFNEGRAARLAHMSRAAGRGRG